MLIVLVVAILAPVRAQAHSPTVLLLRQAGFRIDEDRLLEALRIYTRDIDCVVRTVDEPGGTESPASSEGIAARARREGAAIALWAARLDERTAVFYIMAASDLDLRATEFKSPAGDQIVQTVALKARALLTRPVVVAEKPNDVGVRAQESATLPTTSKLDAPTLLTGGASASGVTESRPMSTARERFALGLSYTLILPTNPTWMRQGFLISLDMRLVRRILWLSLDGALTTRSQAVVRGFSVELRDLPLGLGLQLRWTTSRVGLAAGLRAAAHPLEVRATSPDGWSAVVARTSLGLGGVLRLEIPLLSRVSTYLSGSLEAILPEQRFTIAGQRVATSGPLLVGLGIGVVVTVP